MAFLFQPTNSSEYSVLVRRRRYEELAEFVPQSSVFRATSQVWNTKLSAKPYHLILLLTTDSGRNQFWKVVPTWVGVKLLQFQLTLLTNGLIFELPCDNPSVLEPRAIQSIPVRVCCAKTRRNTGVLSAVHLSWDSGSVL